MEQEIYIFTVFCGCDFCVGMQILLLLSSTLRYVFVDFLLPVVAWYFVFIEPFLSYSQPNRYAFHCAVLSLNFSYRTHGVTIPVELRCSLA